MPNSNPGYIDEIKAHILETELGRLREQFGATGNLSVRIAFKEGDESQGVTGHAQLVLKSGDETIILGFSPANGVAGEVMKASPWNGGVPAKFSIENPSLNEDDPESASILSSEFNFNGATALNLIDDVATKLATPYQTYDWLFRSCITTIDQLVRPFGINVYTIRDDLGILLGPVGWAPPIPSASSPSPGYIATDSFEGPNREFDWYAGDGSRFEGIEFGGTTQMQWWNNAGELQYNTTFTPSNSPTSVLFDVNNNYNWGVKTTATNSSGGSLVTTIDPATPANPAGQFNWKTEIETFINNSPVNKIVVGDNGAVASASYDNAQLVGDIGAQFGSSLGRYLGGNSLIGQLATGTVIGAIGKEIGTALTLGASYSLDLAVKNAFGTLTGT